MSALIAKMPRTAAGREALRDSLRDDDYSFWEPVPIERGYGCAADIDFDEIARVVDEYAEECRRKEKEGTK